MSAGLLVPWVLFVALMLVLAAGAGGLVARAAGRPLGALRLPCGLALVVVICDVCTRVPATARLAVPLVVAAALAGLVLSRPWPRPRPSAAWPALAAAGAFAVYAAPIVLSGEPTFAGYIKLDDTATWLAFTDRVLDHGRTTTGLSPSTYQTLLSSYFFSGYPMGAFLPLGAGARLLGHDPAWLFAPYLALLAALLALSLDTIARAALAPLATGRRRLPPWAPSLAAAVAASAALLFGYTLWGGIKELTGATLTAAFAACATVVLPAGPWRAVARSALPAAVVALAVVATLSVGGLVWLAPALAVVAAPRIRRRPSARQLAAAAALAVAAGAVVLGGFVAANWTGLRDDAALGNLAAPLNPLQVLGVWPVGDFRFTPADLGTTRVLMAEVALAALIAVVHAVRVRAWPLLAYVAGALGAAATITVIGSPWLEAKALAQASPAMVLAALVGAGALALRDHVLPGIALAVCVTAGVAWSDVLAYRAANIAPHDRFAELEAIGERLAGRGPALMTEFEPYGVRHFLRGADAEGASELRVRRVELRSGEILPPGGYADLDELALPGVLEHPALVLRRSPVASRPPVGYERTWQADAYEVWERSARPPQIVAVLPLGDARRPAARPSCRAVARLARTRGGRRLVAAPRRAPVTARRAGDRLPEGWFAAASASGFTALDGSGRAELVASVPRAGRYVAWAQGSFPGRLELSIGGRPVGAVRDRLQQEVQYVRLGTVALPTGRHRIAVAYDRGGWRPGGEGQPAQLGDVVLAPAGGEAPLLDVPATGWRRLCGRTLDWIALTGAG